MGQLTLEICKIDIKATKEAVESYLNKAREYKAKEFIPEYPNITPAYTPRYHGYTGTVGAPTEEIAIRNVDTPNTRRRHVERAEKAVSRLGAKRQKIIRLRYLYDDPENKLFEYQIAQEIDYSVKQYERIRDAALMQLAGSLGLEVEG